MAKSSLQKARMTVHTTIMNHGGDGNILVTFHVFQNGNNFDRSKSIYLRTNESQDLEMAFDEVSSFTGKIQYNVDVNAE
jgi:hypothetical protein